MKNQNEVLNLFKIAYQDAFIEQNVILIKKEIRVSFDSNDILNKV